MLFVKYVAVRKSRTAAKMMPLRFRNTILKGWVRVAHEILKSSSCFIVKFMCDTPTGGNYLSSSFAVFTHKVVTKQ
jgi:hypothetical protein